MNFLQHIVFHAVIYNLYVYNKKENSLCDVVFSAGSILSHTIISCEYSTFTFYSTYGNLLASTLYSLYVCRYFACTFSYSFLFAFCFLCQFCVVFVVVTILHFLSFFSYSQKIELQHQSTETRSSASSVYLYTKILTTL